LLLATVGANPLLQLWKEDRSFGLFTFLKLTGFFVF
jgi:hypothetical protein